MSEEELDAVVTPSRGGLCVIEPKTRFLTIKKLTLKFSLSEMSDVWLRIKSGFSLEPCARWEQLLRLQHPLLLRAFANTCLAHPDLGDRMAGVELLFFARPGLGDASLLPNEERVAGMSCSVGMSPEARSAAPPQREASSTHQDAGQDELQLLETAPQTRTLTRSSSGAPHEGRELVPEEEEDIPELYLLADGDLAGDGSSVDYGFIVAVTCLVTGISLVAISYTVPRDVRVDPDSVSAREMERLEREKARVGGHLDRCVLVGLCLLTLGGALLSTMLMISLWKGEMIRRKAFAYSKHVAKLYGSISLAASASSSTGDSCSRLSSPEEDLGAFS